MIHKLDKLDKLDKLYNTPSEWTPRIFDKNWIKEKDGIYKYKQCPKIIYKIDEKIKKDVNEIIKIKNINDTINTPKYDKSTKNIIVKIYKIYDDYNYIISYTKNTLTMTVKLLYEKYLKNKDNNLFSFKDINNIEIELLNCYKLESLDIKFINEEKKYYNKKFAEDINPLEKYNSICAKIYSDKNISKKKYYFYDYISKTKKIMIYSLEKNIEKTYIISFLKKNKLAYYSGELIFICKEELFGDIHAQITLETKIYNKKYSNFYCIYDSEIELTRTVKIKNIINNLINGELSLKYIDDYSDNEYKYIYGYCYSININGKYFIETSYNTKLKNIIMKMYSPDPPKKYKKVSQELKLSNFKQDVNIFFEYIIYKESDKEELEKVKKSLIRKYKVYKEGLNIKPFNIFKKSFYSKK